MWAGLFVDCSRRGLDWPFLGCPGTELFVAFSGHELVCTWASLAMDWAGHILGCAWARLAMLWAVHGLASTRAGPTLRFPDNCVV
jgi:hypothetical protein